MSRPEDEILAAREAPGPVLRKGSGPKVTAWLDPRARTLGSRVFAADRVVALGLVFYLYLHLGVLSLLLRGEEAWNEFLRLATTTAFLALDVLLLFGLLFHGLNGVRVALVGSGIAPDKHRALFWAATVVGALALLVGAVRILGKG
jgi:succinate dehydrogenase / fumarate reductase cytochrome b subunit